MKIIGLIFLFVSILVNATDLNQTKELNSTKTTISKDNLITKKDKEKLENLEQNLLDINRELKSNVWYNKYTNYELYQQLSKKLKKINYEIENKKTIFAQIDPKLLEKKKNIENNLHLLSEFKDTPFEDILNPKIPQKMPEVKSPFDMVKAFSYLKILKSTEELYQFKLQSIQELINLLKKKEKILEKIAKISPDKLKKYNITKVVKAIQDIEEAYNQAIDTNTLFKKKIEDDRLKIKNDIKLQVDRLIHVAIMIAVIIFLSFVFKLIVKKTITDNERYYMANKFINFSNLILITLILLFSFLENVSYLVTVIGFASAGIAIAMKDLFMSLLGWIVIVFGGSFHVGDRIKVTREGKSFVGDIVDISFLRITILEDITYTTLMENHRAGRMIFIPNNYIFTDVLANYTHEKIKTVWDEVDIIITFDSNYTKAVHLAKEIVKKYSKGYTEISRRQLNLLRNKYSLKNINVEPRVYTFITDYGIKIACWYMTNSYATLTLRSSISANLIDMVNNNDDIKIAYPTEVVNIKKDPNVPKKIENKEPPSEESLS